MRRQLATCENIITNVLVSSKLQGDQNALDRPLHTDHRMVKVDLWQDLELVLVRVCRVAHIYPATVFRERTAKRSITSGFMTMPAPPPQRNIIDGFVFVQSVITDIAGI